jgi:predicted metal-binding membrane protein
MSASSLTEWAMRHDRLVVISSLSAVVLLSWLYLLNGAGLMQSMDGMLMPMSAGPWTLTDALLMFAMWVVMMAAMMLPSASPTILLYGVIARRRHPDSAFPLASGAFILGYVVAWTMFSLMAVSLQFALQQAALISPMMGLTSVALAGTVLIATGVYQLTPLKQACLRHCRSPLEFITTQWRTGVNGAFSMGLRHGVYCVGCCWSLMLLLFVGGVMNFAWIGGIALFVLVEKLAPAGRWTSRGAGVLLIFWGAATLLSM